MRVRTCAPVNLCTVPRPSDSRIAQSARDAIAEVTGEPAQESGVAYWMDAALFSAAGIPTVNYGPSGEGAHGAVEWVDLASVESCTATLVATAKRFLAAQ